jgi:hypothetical protein
MSLEDISDPARDELAALSRRLSEDPSTRKEFLRMTKKVRPDLPIPELDIEDRAMAISNASVKRVEQLENQLRERDAVDNLQQRRSNLVKKGLVNSEDEIASVEKIMLDKKIHDHETAANYLKWEKESAAPTPTGYNPNPMKQFDLSAFRKNPVQAARDTAAQALRDFRKPTRPIGL